MYTFVPNKSFGWSLNISFKNFIFLKTFNSEFSYIEVWPTDQNAKPLETEDKISNTLVINESVKHKKIIRYSVQPRGGMLVIVYGFLCLTKNMGKYIGKNVSKSLNDKCLFFNLFNNVEKFTNI